MSLDDQSQAFIARLGAQPQPPPGSIPIADFRAAITALAPLGFEVEDVAEVRDVRVPSPTGPDVPVRAYRPAAAGGAPIVVWVHGGSWVRCDLDTHDALLRVVANRSGCVVVSVGYRLAPEAPFPLALDDIEIAVRWALEHGEDLGGRGGPVAIAGDSSGANLAAATTLRARTLGDLPIAHQTLLLPVLDLRLDSPSWRELGDDYLLTREGLAWGIGRYAPGADLTDPLLSPLLAVEHAGLPPALIVTGEYDPLRDDGEQYAEALQRSGVAVDHVRCDGLIHHAMLVPKAIERGRRAVEEVADLLGEALHATVRS